MVVILVMTISAAFIILVVVVAGLVAWHRISVRVRTMLEPVLDGLITVSAKIDGFLAKHSYARESHRQSLVTAAKEAVDRTRTPYWLFFASPDHKKTLATLSRFIADSTSMVEQANSVFIESEVGAFGELFDTVESKPLTSAQRRSCVVNEDNNLVLAGAGTGKTSTMIGRAGYLLASQRARPEELLMLAFAKKAAEEMQGRQDNRLERWLKDGAPTIKTFHALGLEIIGAVESHRPDLTPMAEDDHRFAKFINDQIDEHCDDPEYQAMVVRYCGSERFPYRNPFDFNSMTEYHEYVRTNELRTLKGEVVKSFEEVAIANFLSANSVNYEYENPYEIHTAGPDFRQYKPDFFLPDHGVYIEHFALNRDGQPPSHFDQQKYLAGITWKRGLHQEYGTRLVETYSYLKREGLLESYLAECLQKAGVELHRKPNEELLDELRRSSEIAEFAMLLADFLKLFKQSDHDVDALRSVAAKHIDSPRMLLLLDLFAPIREAYEANLSQHKQIDFADMIRRATEHVQSGSFRSPYTNILVDEFQDISGARARLVLSLVRQHPESVLFVVGDDWQSIYRFTGSDIAYTRGFGSHFGPTATIPLDLTFRFNDQIGEVASRFILKNPAQIVKSITSSNKTPQPAVSLIRVVTVEAGLNLALDAIDNRSKCGCTPVKTTVMVLGRYNFVVEKWRKQSERRRIRTMHPDLDVEFMTVHAAKGKEADYVVVLGLGRGKYGFPSEKPTDSVLEFLLPDQESFPLAEERRLFYVALTRARHRVYLAYDPREASSFVLELLSEEERYPVCIDEFDNSPLVCGGIPHVPCPSCGSGALILKNGPYDPFVGCNHFPYCRYTEKPCPQCGHLMRRINSVRECTNPACNAVVPICQKCGGSMVERNGPYGRFWGCINYRNNSDFVCTYTISI
jgi:DNA helicase-4